MRASPIALALFALFAMIVPPPAAAFLDHPHAKGELIVAFREDTPRTAQDAVLAQVGGTVVRRSEHRAMSLVRFDDSVSLEQREVAYRAFPEVIDVQPNYIGEGGFVPNDTFYGNQWHHRNIGQFGGTSGADIESEAGWDLDRGNPATVVAVLDTGIDSDHPDFVGRIVAGWDFVNNDADPEADHDHGALVSGLLAANADNSFAVAGVNHFCKIMPVKVLDQFNFGTTFNLISGIDYARVNGANVISMSLINYPLTTTLNSALRDAKLAGAIPVACAGNGGIGDADVSAPGNSSHTISIGATTNTDARASYSGTGQALDYVAPGDDVVTVAWNTFVDTAWFFNGCSAATPVAAGIVSILKGLDPSLTASQVRSFLTAGAEDQVGPPSEDTPGWDEYFGNGRVNLRATLEAYLATVVAAPEVGAGARDLALSVDPNPSRAGTTVSFSMDAMDWVKLTLYDVSGRHVRTLVDGIRAAGAYRVRWDGTEANETAAAPGIYFARIETLGRTETTKVTLMR